MGTLGFERRGGGNKGQRWEWLGSERNVGQELLHCCLCYYFRCYDSRSSSDAIPQWLLNLTLLFPLLPQPRQMAPGLNTPSTCPLSGTPPLLPLATPLMGLQPWGLSILLRGPGLREPQGAAIIASRSGGNGLEDEAKASGHLPCSWGRHSQED